MRIISGEFKGRKIDPPKNLPVRPTTDMAKESLFNILNNTYYFDELTVLDLFSGTGSISYEFSSRGTTNVTAVDSDHGCTKFIYDTAKKFNMPIQVVKSDVFKFLQSTKNAYDIIFADPPYALALEDFTKIVELVFSESLLAEDGLLIIEHSKHTDLSEMQNFSHFRNYGGCVFSFFEQPEE